MTRTPAKSVNAKRTAWIGKVFINRIDYREVMLDSCLSAT